MKLLNLGKHQLITWNTFNLASRQHTTVYLKKPIYLPFQKYDNKKNLMLVNVIVTNVHCKEAYEY